MSDVSGTGPDRSATTDLTDDVAAVDRDGMGVSSERVGPTGPGQVGRTGLRDTSRSTAEALVPMAERRPEQSPGGVEVNPDPIALPKAGFPQQHPRAKERPFSRRRS